MRVGCLSTKKIWFFFRCSRKSLHYLIVCKSVIWYLIRISPSRLSLLSCVRLIIISFFWRISPKGRFLHFVCYVYWRCFERPSYFREFSNDFGLPNSIQYLAKKSFGTFPDGFTLFYSEVCWFHPTTYFVLPVLFVCSTIGFPAYCPTFLRPFLTFLSCVAGLSKNRLHISVSSCARQSPFLSLTSAALDLPGWGALMLSTLDISLPSFPWTFDCNGWDPLCLFASGVACGYLL